MIYSNKTKRRKLQVQEELKLEEVIGTKEFAHTTFPGESNGPQDKPINL